MANLPDEFDSKRELDAWLAENVRGEEVCHKTRDECGGCEKMVYKGLTKHVGARGMETGSEVVRHYTTNREAALDLLEVFCKERKPVLELYSGYIFLDLPPLDEPITEQFCERYKIDPLAVSVAIYRAYKQIEEA